MFNHEYCLDEVDVMMPVLYPFVLLYRCLSRSRQIWDPERSFSASSEQLELLRPPEAESQPSS